MLHVLALYNPSAGSSLLRPSAQAIKRRIEQEGATVTWVETRADGNDAIVSALQSPYDRIIVIGGDGTVRDIAHLLLTATIPTPLAIIPYGTGNILAQSLGIPLFPLQRAIACALHGPVHAIDVLRINNRHTCLIGAGQGYDSLFIHGATRALKSRIGPLAYAWSFLYTFLPYVAHRYTIVVDGTRHYVLGKIVLALNTFSIAGIPLEQSLSAHDGWIDLFVFNPRTVWETIHIGLRLLTGQPRTQIPRLQTWRGKRISIRQRKGKHIQLDGDVRPDRHLDIVLLPGALRIVHKTTVDEGS